MTAGKRKVAAGSASAGRRAAAAPPASVKPRGARQAPAMRRSAAAASTGGSLWPMPLRSMADQFFGLVGSAAELSLGVGNALVRRPSHRRALQKAGAFLRDARETAGLSVREVSSAIDLDDPSLLDLAESGKAALPFEVLLRLAALLARNDPVPFLMQFVRNYSPSLWKALEQLGLAGLVLHAGREHEFINVYRSRDAARRLSDAEFARVLAFTDAAFEMALGHVADGKRAADEGARPRKRAKRALRE